MIDHYEPMELPIGNGLDTQSNRAMLPPGQLRAVSNVSFAQKGQWTKRKGFDQQLGVSLGASGTLATHGQHLTAHIARKLYDYSKSANLFKQVGTLRAVPTRTSIVQSSNVDVTGCDACSAGNFTLVAWIESSVVKAKVIDDITGAVVSTQNINGFSNSNGITRLSCLGFVDGTSITHFYVVVAGQIIHAQYGAGSFAWDAGPTTLQANAYAGRAYYDTATATLYMGIATSTAVFGYKLQPFLSLIGSSSFTIAVDANAPVDITVNNGFLYIAYYSVANGLSWNAASTSALVWAGAVVVGTSVIPQHMSFAVLNPGAGATGYLLFDDKANVGTTQSIIYTYTAFSGGGTVAPSVLYRSVSLASRVAVDTVSGVAHFLAVYYSAVSSNTVPPIQELNSTALVLTLDGAMPAHVFRGTALTQLNTASASLTITGYLFAARVLSTAEYATIQAALSLGAVGLVRFDYSSEVAQTVSSFHDMYVAGGAPSVFDGSVVTDLGFPVYPEILTSKVATVGDFTSTTVARNTPYTVGALINLHGLFSSAVAGSLWMCVTSGKSANVLPAYPNAPGATMVDGTATFQCVGYGCPITWTAGAAETTGSMFLPTVRNGFEYVVSATTVFVTGGAEPVWPTVIGNTVTLNNVTYMCLQAERTTLVAGDVYSWQIVYSLVDANGQLHRSRVSVARSATPTTTNESPLSGTAILLFTNLRLGSKTNVRAEIYRTSGNGFVCQQIGTVANNPATDCCAVMDTVPDTTQALGGVLLQGSLGAGQFLTVTPPSCSVVASWKQRLAANDLENTLLVHLSKLVVEGLAPEFSDELAIVLNGKYGACTALGAMDGKLVVFQENGIGMVDGDGPDNTGGGTDFGQVRMVSSDVGCLYPASVRLTTLGLVFQGTKGMYLLDRNESLNFIGEPVLSAFASTQVVASIVDPTNQQLVFLTAAGTIHVYDFARNVWGSWTIAGVTPVGLAAWNGTVVVLGSTGSVYQQTGVSYTEPNATKCAVSFEIGGVRLNGVQGFGRVRGAKLKFLSDTGAGITVQVKNDFNNTVAQTSAPVTIAAGEDGFEVRMVQRRLSAIALVVTETTPGDGLALQGIVFDVGILPGTTRNSPTTRRTY